MKNKTNKTKSLSKTAMIKNINGLSEGDRAYCGPYGTVTCVKRAMYVVNNNGRAVCRRNSRKFKVTSSSKIYNGGNYTMRSLRKAICV